jgi:hypothetical protein
MNNFEDYKNIVYRATLGNQAAIDYLMMAMRVVHLWDDLIDKDKAVSHEAINSGFMDLLIDLPRNPFYMAYLEQLTAVTQNAIRNWLLSNCIEQDRELDIPLECSFILRSSYSDVVCTVATICGGHNHGLEIAKEIRSLAHAEKFDGYINNLAIEKIAKEANAKG